MGADRSALVVEVVGWLRVGRRRDPPSVWASASPEGLFALLVLWVLWHLVAVSLNVGRRKNV